MADIGSTLGGRYRLIELLGQGGMATIYRAHDAQLGRDVAVKLLRPQYGRDPDFLARFRDEARSVAALSHPNIVQVFDYGEDESGPYIVMELVEGDDLASIVRDTGPLPPRQAARISAEIAKALHAAHGRGIVHRDVKPSNVLVSRDGRVKVADFGIARALAESQLTLPGTTLGSVHYFSPEQARGEPATPASDIYALGIVLFETLTGQRPFAGDGAAAVALARLQGPPPRPSDIRSSVPPALDAVVARAMAREPEARFASAASMANALEAYLADRPDAALAAAGAGGAVAGAGAVAASAAMPPVGGETVASAAARPNVGRTVPYVPEAYADPGEIQPRPARRPPARYRDERDEPGGTAWGWVAGLLALLVLAAVAFVVFQLLTAEGGGSEDRIELQELVGRQFADARADLADQGLELVEEGTQATRDAEPGTILSQDPEPGTLLDPGDEVRVVVAVGLEEQPVPRLIGLTEEQALALLLDQEFTLGERTEEHSPDAPEGTVIAQDPVEGVLAAPGTPIKYTISLGPEPTPSPTPSPTPEPTPEPTQPPTERPRNVGTYVCLSLEEAITAIEDDGYVPGSVVGAPEGYPPDGGSTVVSQDPRPGANRPPGTAIDLVAADPATVAGCP